MLDRTKTPVKVAMVTSYPLDPSVPFGGVESVSVNLVRALSKYDDLELHVVTTCQACRMLTRVQSGNVTIHRLPWVGRQVLTHVLGPGRRDLCRYLKWLEPDLIHAHDIYGIMVRKIPIPRIFTVHGFIHADTRTGGKKFCRLRSRLWRKIEWANFADQPHIISISPYVREYIKHIATGVIHDVDNPVGEEFFKVTRHERRGTIFSAALLCPRKNMLGLLEAFRRMIHCVPDAELRLAGAAHDADYDLSIRQFIRDHNLSDRVVLLGGIDADKVRQELSQAAVFALVSFEEGAPMGVAEAMAAAVPVVTSNRCGMPYMVRDGETGYLVDPNDPSQIARALQRVLLNDSLRASMGQKAVQIAIDRFHPDRVAARTREIYLRAIDDFYRGLGDDEN